MSKGYTVASILPLLLTGMLFAASPVAVPRTNTITIDGDITDFNTSSPTALDKREQLSQELQPGRSWKGTNDLSATVYFNYDDEYLYIGAYIFDAVRTHIGRTGNFFNGDGFELFLSGYFHKNRTNTFSGKDDYQLYFLPPTSPHEELLIYKAKGGEKTSSVLTLYGITAACREFGDHYTMEIRIPLYLFGTDDIRRSIGLNVAVDDADNTPYRKSQLTMNGSPLAYVAPRYSEPLQLKGAFHRSTAVRPPTFLIILVVSALALITGYGIGLRFIIVLPLLLKIRIVAVSGSVLFLCTALWGTIALVLRSVQMNSAENIAVIDRTVMSNISTYSGRMDFDELSQRLYSYVSGSILPDMVPYRSTTLIPKVAIIHSRQGTPMRIEPPAAMNWTFTNDIAPVRARGVRIILSGYSAFPNLTNIGEAYTISFHTTNDMRFDYILTNGVNLFNAEYRYRMGSNAINSSRIGIGTLNPDTQKVTGIAEEHELLFPGTQSIRAISFTRRMSAASLFVRAVTFIDETGHATIVGPFIPTSEWYSWQGTRIARYVSISSGYDGYINALRTPSYPFNDYADEIRVQFNGSFDSASRDTIPFGSVVATVDICYNDGSIERTPIIDGLSYSTASEVFGHGHPPHFTSRVSRRVTSQSGMISHDKELNVPTRSDKKIDSIRFSSVLPETRITAYGITAIRRAPERCMIAALSQSHVRTLSVAEPMVYYDGVVIPRSASSNAIAAVRSYIEKHPPYDGPDFRLSRIVRSAGGVLITTPLAFRNDTSPVALMHFIPDTQPFIALILNVMIVLSGFFTFVSVLLLLAHIIIDARKLSMKMMVISISLAVVPLAAVTTLFIYIYNRTAANEMLAGRSILSESFIQAEIAGSLSSLADRSRRACAAILTGGGEGFTNEHVYYLVHDVDQSKRSHRIWYSPNTPPRFIRVESTRLLKRSGPVLNSAFGPALAWTTIRTDGGRIVSVTAFSEIDDATLAFWRERTMNDISIHYMNGYRYASTLPAPFQFHVTATEGGIAHPENSERIIDGRQYYLHAFALRNEMKEEQMLIGTVIDAAPFARTRLLIVTGGIAFALIAGALAFAIAWWFSRRISGAVLTVAGGMKRVETGELSVSVTVDSRDEIASLADGFNTMARTLSNLRTTDLQMAAKVQRGLLPALPTSGRYDVAVHYEAYSYVSGDFYDFYTDESGALTGLVLFDVSGHGVSSGLITTLVRPILYRMFTPDTNVPLSEVIAKANRSIIKAKGDVDNYLTCIMLRFAGEVIQYVNAGHPDLIRKDAASGIQPIKNDGTAVQGAFMGHEGMVEFFEETNHEYRFAMKEGDTFLLFTDGLIEAKSPDKIEFGIENIKRILAEAPSNISAAELIGRFVEAGERHRKGAPLSDDITIVVVKVRG